MRTRSRQAGLNKLMAIPRSWRGRSSARAWGLRSIALALVALAGLLTSGLPQAQISGTKWAPIGPAPIGGFFKGGVSGRATAIAVNPFDGDQVWLGTAQGGIWFSPDAGTTWYPMTDGMGALAIGAIAVAGCDAVRCTKVFAGTGENAIRRDTYYGRGLLVGSYLTGDDPPTFVWFLRQGDANVDFNLGSINDVIFVPNPQGGPTRVLVTFSSGVTASATESTVTAPESTTGGYGIYSSNDDGVTWTKLNVAGAAGERPTDLEIDPDDASTLYAGFLGIGVFKSEDGGTNWCPLNEGIIIPPGCADTTGLPDGGETAFDHVEMAVYESNPSILYASFGHCTDQLIRECVPSLYKTINGGLTWTLQYVGSANPSGSWDTEPQGYSRYTHALTIHPTNDSVLYMGGMRLWLSNNSGVSFGTFDQNNAPGSSIYGNILHLDHREVLWDPSNLNRIYDVNDGGIASTVGAGWYPANDGLQITGFHSLTASPLTDRVIGGTQDNSATMWTGSKTWAHMPCCGDSGSTVIDAVDPLVLYALGNYGDVQRSLDGGVSWCGANSGLPNKAVQPRAFYAPLEQDLSSPHPLYWAGQKLYKAQPGGSCSNVIWSAVSPALETGPQPEIYGGEDVITAIGISESNPGRIYLGHYGGGIYRTDAACDNSSCWTDIGAGLPDAPITRIAVHATLQDTVLVTLSGFAAGAHVWKTTDGGVSWSAAATGVPDGIPANTIHFEPGSPAVLWLGLDGNPTASSIYRSTDTGASWTAWSTALPNVPVYDIALDPSRNRAFAGTHGRGAYMLSDNPLIFKLKEPEIPVDGRPYDFFFMGWLFPEGPGPVECVAELMLLDGTTCAAGVTDALGQEIMVGAEGRLMTGAREMAWGCFGGTCIGGTPMDECMQAGNPLSQIVVTCDGETGIVQLADPVPAAGPPSTRLGVNLSADPGAEAGGAGGGAAGSMSMMAGNDAFHLSSILQNGDGTSRSLCTVHVPILAGELNDDIMSRAAAAINSSPTCMAEGLTASLIGLPEGQEGEEDVFSRNMNLMLAAPGLTGSQLLAVPHAGPGEATDACFDITGLGVPVHDLLQGMAVEFMTGPGGALGGQISLSQESVLGACGVTVATLMGDSAADIASRVASAINAPAGPSPDCLSRHYAGDTLATGDMINMVAASAIRLCNTDPGVGFQLISDETDNLHPTAVVTSAAATECTTPNGAMVLLDGSLSKDPDSSPGTNDDIVRFEWFEDYGLASQLFLGNGDLLNVQLALGIHSITLKVIDSQGLEDTSTVQLSVVDTTFPTISGIATPSLLFPANHAMQTVITNLTMSDACTPDPILDAILIAAVSDESDDAPGPQDGATTNDIQDTQFATPDFSVRLRAERDSSLAGRTYTLTYMTTDGGGNSASTQLTVFVPLDVDGTTEPIIITVVAAPLGTLLSWTPHEGATAYNIIKVDVANFADMGSDYDLGVAECVEGMSADLSTLGDEDPVDPDPGEAVAYLVESMNGYISGYGTESAEKWRMVVPPEECFGP